MQKKKAPSRDKRLKVDVWVTDGLREAVGQLMRDDGKPANDEQIRLWAQGHIDDASVKEVDRFDSHRRARRKRRGQ